MRRLLRLVQYLLIPIALTTLLPGCMSSGWENRYGPAPVIDAADVVRSTNNQFTALESFSMRAGLGGGLPAIGSENWYLLVDAGFGYVDEQCDAYIRDLFILNRRRDRLTKGISLAGATTAAIMGATGASAESLAIVASLFGFGANATDLAADSYLYQISPTSLDTFVRELRSAYREGSRARYRLITTPAAAYKSVHEYLSLCLPQTIETKINEHVGRVQVIPDLRRNSPNVELLLTSSQPLPSSVIRAAALGGAGSGGTGPRYTQPADPRGPVRPAPDPSHPAQDTRNVFEQRIPSDDWLRYKEALCVRGSEAASNHVGQVTRDQIQAFISGWRSISLTQAERSITERNKGWLDAAAKGTYAACRNRAKNAFEVGLLSRDPSVAAQVDIILRNALIETQKKGFAKAGALLAAPSGFDSRAAIAALRDFYELTPRPGTALDEFDDRVWIRVLADGRVRE